MGGALDEVAPDRLNELARLYQRGLTSTACLRCGSDNHWVRAFHNPRLPRSFSSDEVLETVCQRCGMVETHIMEVLIRSVEDRMLPDEGDGT
jgi:ribosomal protein L37E